MARLRPTQWGTCVICHSGAILYEGDEGEVCEHCADLQELQKPLDEARAHVDALVKGWVGGEDHPCQYCGHRYNHSKDCVYEAARKWLEAQDDDSD